MSHEGLAISEIELIQMRENSYEQIKSTPKK
jgi:hypothetical protein